MSRHHVVLVPGFFGFGSLGELTYFVGVREALTRAFERFSLDVNVVEVSTLPTASIRHRAARVQETLAQIAEASGFDTVTVGQHHFRQGDPAAPLTLLAGIVTHTERLRVGVGLLLISALMIVPNAAAQLLGTSFRSTMRWAVVIGVVCAVSGVIVSYEADTPSGGTIVVLAIGVFVLALNAGIYMRVFR